MRIQIHAGQGPRRADDCPPPPPPLARLTPNGELVLVELQGSLEMDGVDPEGGQTIGVLRFPEGREVRARCSRRTSLYSRSPITCSRGKSSRFPGPSRCSKNASLQRTR